MQPSVIWITGAGGFIGANLAAYFARIPVTVIGIGRNRSNNLPLTTEGLNIALSVHGRPERVFHLAGGSTVGQSLTDPLADFHSNITTTAILLDVLRDRCPDVPVVMSSSAAVYGTAHSGPLDMSTPLSPVSPYGHHKVMAEHLCRSYAASFGLRITILRLFSIYGPGLRKQLLFDLCTRMAKGHVPVPLGGTGQELRDWCHVGDVVRAMASLEKAAPGQVACHNLGSAKAVDVATMARLLAEAWGEKRLFAFSGQMRPGDPFSLVADVASLPPGFSPRIPLEQGLREFVGWFRTEGAAPS